MQRSHSIIVGSVLVVLGLVVMLMTADRDRSPISTSDPKAEATADASNPKDSSDKDRASSDVAASSSTAAQAKQTASSSKPLLVYCAASNRAAMDAIVADYRKEFGREIQLQYGPSQTLLSSLEVSGTGDLYLPADNSYIELAQQKQLLAEVLPLADMQVVLAVAQGNPKAIRQLDDLLRSDVKLVQANPDAAAVGKVIREELRGRNLWDKIDKATTAYRVTVNDVASDLVVGAADVGFVYDAVLVSYPKLESVALPELEKCKSRVSIAVTKSCANPASALHFARYVSARDRGLKRYAEKGFTVVKGDVWKDRPELSIFAGSMLRPAIDRTITAFEEREGVRVSRVYNGCGILIAQMKAGQRPDAYFACDKEFMNSVPDLFPEPVDVSRNELVILVQKGNPHNIKNLKDLGRSGIRVGIGHEKQCAMGWLTQNTLREGGVQKEVMANVAVQTPTGDMLVNQLRAGGLDAAVVYLSNAVGAGAELDAIRIVGLPCSIAIQPFAVAVDSPNARLAERLFERLRSTESKKTFLDEGFLWFSDQTANEPIDQSSSSSAAAADKSDSDSSAPANSDSQKPATQKPATQKPPAPQKLDEQQ